MAAPAGWRIKGVDKETQQLAEEAAARSGLTVGEWLERAIDNNADLLPPEDDAPLVPMNLLDSARDTVTSEEIEPAADDNIDQAADQDVEATGADEDDEPADGAAPPLEEAGSEEPAAAPVTPVAAFKQRSRQVPNVSPTLIPAEFRKAPSSLPRLMAGLVLIALIVGAYWLIDWNARTKFEAETDAVAGRSVATTIPRGEEAKSEQARQATPSPLPPVLTPLQKLTIAASGGDMRSQYDLGLMYIQGNGVPRDPKQGAKWLEESASAGMPNAQYQVALLYQQGLGVPSDMKMAFKWFEKAANQGHVRAQYELGTLYADGKGTRKDYAAAHRWFTRASKEGLSDAHYSLGLIYENGLGVERDQRQAATYYRRALAAGSTQAASKLARLEPALKELARSAEVARIESHLTVAPPEGGDTVSKDRPLSAAGIRNLQQLLKKLDLEPGPADGILGDKTIEAIRLYQRFAGLPVDGKPTLELLLDLRQVVGAMSAEKPAGATPASGR